MEKANIPTRAERGGVCFSVVQEPDHGVPPLPEPPLPRPGDPSEEQKAGQNDSDPKSSQWQRSSDLTPEAWQQQMDQQLREEEGDHQGEALGNHGHPQGSEKPVTIFRDSKSMKTYNHMSV